MRVFLAVAGQAFILSGPRRDGDVDALAVVTLAALCREVFPAEVFSSYPQVEDVLKSRLLLRPRFMCVT